MSCCNVTISSFVNATSTTLTYSGAKPTVSVQYLQPDGTFIQSGILTLIEITATSVIIDHGGPASGVIKLLQ